MRAILVGLVLFFHFGVAHASNRDLLIFAAASQRDALLKVGALYENQCQCSVNFSFAASSTLARQIVAGAPADVFVSANRAWIEWLSDRKKILGDPEVIARNRLVIVSAAPLENGIEALKKQRFAMGNPIGVPAGIYARQALESLGIWDTVKSNAVFTENVRVGLSLISRRDLELGIVYASDHLVSPELHKSHLFETKNHAPIEYVAVIVGEKLAASSLFMEYLRGDDAQLIFKEYGFVGIDQ